MFKVQVMNTIASIGLNQFPNESYDIATDVQEPDVILVRSASLHQLQFPSSLKVVGRAGAGVNNIPVAQLTQLGVPVLNTPGANANAVRELVIAGMLFASRNIYPAIAYVNQLNMSQADMEKQIEQDKKQFVGFELAGKTLGVVGLGSVGVKVANAAVHLGMQVIGYDPTITVNRAWELSSGVAQAHSLDSLLKEADFITFHIPLLNETKHMISEKQFQIMKNHVVLLNFSRAGIIDENALLSALNVKKVFCYVNDFPSQQLHGHSQVISLPHLGASTKEAEENCAVMIVKQVRDFLENGNIVNAVNFPTIQMPKLENHTRIAVVNANVPNMVAQISAKLAAAQCNISGLMNGSHNEIAYTLIDIDGKVDEVVLKEVAGIDGVRQVRNVGFSLCH